MRQQHEVKGKEMKQKIKVALQGGIVFSAVTIGIAATATAAPKPFDHAKQENWGVSVRNTIGSPVAQPRDGMSSRLTPGGVLTEPPFGNGTLGIEVSNAASSPGPEKVDFGNEVD